METIKKVYENQNLNFNIYDLFVCPSCKGKLKKNFNITDNTLKCEKCNVEFLIRDSIPIFQVVTDTPEFKKKYLSISTELRGKLNGGFYNFLQKLYVHPLKVSKESKKIENNEIVETLPTNPKILNLGSGEFLTSKQPLFKKYRNNIVNIDIDFYEGINAVCDAHELPFKSESFDLIYIKCVFEHVRDTETVIKECHRVMKKGGKIFITTPFIARHHSNSDYRRWTLMGVEYIMRDFTLEKIGIHSGPASALALFLREFWPIFFNNKLLHFATKFLVSYLVYPICWLDPLIIKKNAAFKLAQAFYYLGHK